jgi:hypothetical protein
MLMSPCLLLCLLDPLGLRLLSGGQGLGKQRGCARAVHHPLPLHHLRRQERTHARFGEEVHS